MPEILLVCVNDELDELTELDAAWNKNEWIGRGCSEAQRFFSDFLNHFCDFGRLGDKSGQIGQ